MRSATYCLGAMQELAAIGGMRKVDQVTAVSGGSYIAAAWALQALQTCHDGPAGYRGAYQEAFRPGVQPRRTGCVTTPTTWYPMRPRACAASCP
jgi:hypothetical protein